MTRGTWMVSDGCAPTGDARGRTTRALPVAPVLLAAASSRMARFRLNAALEAHRKSPWICARPRSLILRNPAIGSTQPKTRSTRGPTGLTQRVALVQRGAEINRTAAHPVRVLTHVRRRTQGAHGGDDARRVVRPVVPDATPPPYAVRQQERRGSGALRGPRDVGCARLDDEPMPFLHQYVAGLRQSRLHPVRLAMQPRIRAGLRRMSVGLAARTASLIVRANAFRLRALLALRRLNQRVVDREVLVRHPGLGLRNHEAEEALRHRQIHQAIAILREDRHRPDGLIPLQNHESRCRFPMRYSSRRLQE